MSLETVGFTKDALEKAKEKWEKNPMLKPRISKVTVNVSLGQGGERLVKVAKVLEEITGQAPKFRKAKRTIRDFGIRRGENIAVAVTLKGEKAVSFLRRAFEAVGNRLKFSSFDNEGNVSFGIQEHINIPGVKYDPEIGVFGMDVCITIERPGYRVKKRRVKRARRVPKRHRVTREEAAALLSEEFGVTIV
jgi:large subunit ribosomal protein L5